MANSLFLIRSLGRVDEGPFDAFCVLYEAVRHSFPLVRMERHVRGFMRLYEGDGIETRKGWYSARRPEKKLDTILADV